MTERLLSTFLHAVINIKKKGGSSQGLLCDKKEEKNHQIDIASSVMMHEGLVDAVAIVRLGNALPRVE